MASVSLALTVDEATVRNPQNVAVGTAAPSGGADIELRVDMSKFTSLEQIFLALEQFDDFINDQNLGPNTFKVL